jgi:hypothetical protein
VSVGETWASAAIVIGTLSLALLVTSKLWSTRPRDRLGHRIDPP